MGSVKGNLIELEQVLHQFNENTTLDELYQYIECVRTAASSTAATDRKRVDLQIAALRLVWLRDGLTGATAWRIIGDSDASFAQKARAFKIWLGVGSA